MSVRATEDLIRKLNSRKTPKKTAEIPNYIKNGLNKISAFIGHKAQIKVSKKDQGNISIPFHSKEEFERILKLFKGD